MKNGLVVFDLDGTLIDTSQDLIKSLNFCLESFKMKTVRYEDLTFLVGQGARVMISRAFELNGQTISSAQLEELMEMFIDHYQRDMPGSSKPYSGLIDAMIRLQDDGFKLAVCTNKTEELALKLLDKLSLSHFFTAVTGGDTFTYRKPDGRHILSTIDRAGADRKKSIMIGDSINDIAAARDAGIPSLAVPFGYSDVPVEELNPTGIMADYKELTPELVLKLMG